MLLSIFSYIVVVGVISALTFGIMNLSTWNWSIISLISPIWSAWGWVAMRYFNSVTPCFSRYFSILLLSSLSPLSMSIASPCDITRVLSPWPTSIKCTSVWACSAGLSSTPALISKLSKETNPVRSSTVKSSTTKTAMSVTAFLSGAVEFFFFADLPAMLSLSAWAIFLPAFQPILLLLCLSFVP